MIIILLYEHLVSWYAVRLVGSHANSSLAIDNSYLTVTGMHEMHGRMHPSY